jgi:hypothetical protein
LHRELELKRRHHLYLYLSFQSLQQQGLAHKLQFRNHLSLNLPLRV